MPGALDSRASSAAKQAPGATSAGELHRLANGVFAVYDPFTPVAAEAKLAVWAMCGCRECASKPVWPGPERLWQHRNSWPFPVFLVRGCHGQRPTRASFSLFMNSQVF